MAGDTSRRRRPEQTGHRSTCRLTRLRTSTVSTPSQSWSIAFSSGQSWRPVRATTSAPSAVSSWSRARDSSACAWLREIPSTLATSPPAQALPQLQFEDFPLGRPDPAERVAHQGAQVRPLHVRGDVGRFVGHVRRLLDGRVQAAGRAAAGGIRSGPPRTARTAAAPGRAARTSGAPRSRTCPARRRRRRRARAASSGRSCTAVSRTCRTPRRARRDRPPRWPRRPHGRACQYRSDAIRICGQKRTRCPIVRGRRASNRVSERPARPGSSPTRRRRARC